MPKPTKLQQSYDYDHQEPYLDLQADVLGGAKNYPLAQEMQAYLQQRGMMPPVKQDIMPNGVSGEFRYPVSDPKALGAITLDSQAGNSQAYSHELAHAVRRQLMHQYNNQIGPKPVEAPNPQFLDAYQKTMFEGRGEGLPLAASQPGFMKEGGGYRTSSTELVPWAVGNMHPANNGAQMSDRSPAHVDATLATQLAILTELASRKPPPK